VPDRPEGPVGPVDATQVPRYAGPPTFARLPRIDEVGSVDVAVLGVPFDSGVSYRPGARFGPSHIRQSSRLLRPYNPAQDVMPFGSQQVADAGDLGVNPFDIGEAIEAIEAGAESTLTRASRLLTLGGDHTIALPLLRCVARRHGPVAVLHFDAHLDTWDTYFGAPYTHGTPFRRAAEEGLDGVIAAMRERLGEGPVYVSVDIDVIDPGMAPGTGTPEAGGLASRELLATLRGLSGLDIVSADIVEVAPAYDHAEVTGIAAAHVGFELLSVMAQSPM
jgi:agmatinase